MIKCLGTLIVFLTAVTSAIGQTYSLVLTEKVTDDSISIKWIPSDFGQYKLIANGVKVSRIESSERLNYASLDFQNAKTWTIEPVKKRYEKLDLTLPKNEKMGILLEPLFKGKQSEELENFAFGTALIENIVNPDFQFVLGNIVVDKEFEKNKSYVYKIEATGIKPTFITIDTKNKTKYSEIDVFDLSLDAKKTVDIEWIAKQFEKEAFGFEIEHSIDEILEGNYLTETPFLPFKSDQEIEGTTTRYRDSPEPGHYHFYRLHGLDLFGHPSLVSEWKKIYVPLLINAVASIDTLYALQNERHINGVIHVFNSNANVAEVALLRSIDRETNYEIVQRLPFEDTLVQFELNAPKTGDHYYYKLMLANKDDFVFSSPRYLFTLDQDPPEPPTNITGTIDSNGVVNLIWEQPIDDDILGYRVFRANSKREEFIEKTTRLSKELTFSDTLRLDNLTSEVYYSLQSVDLNYNQSRQSDTILILKPDTISPVPAVVKDVIVTTGSLKISWTNSDSEDVKTNSLMRNSEGKTEMVFTWSNSTIEFVDTNVVPGINYEYQIVSSDESKNESRSVSFSKYYEPGFRAQLSAFEATVNKAEKAIVLQWSAPKDEVFSYQLFRGKEGEKLLLLKTISDGSITQFKDKNVRINNKYIYTVKYVNAEGIHSLPTKLEVIYQ